MTDSPRILVAGSINTDLVMQVTAAPEAGETVTGQSFATFGGGKGANQAVSAARSGAQVAMLGGLGKDAFGQQRLLDLQHEGIATETVSVFDDLPSGVAIILVEPGGENRIAYVPGATWGVTPELATSAIERWNPDVILATLEHRPATLEALWREAAARDIPVICNATPEPADGRALALAASMLVVNEVEAAALLGRDLASGAWPDAARALRDLGPAVVVITTGSQGAVVASGDGTDVVPAPQVDAVDTTGAGDAFCGAFAAEVGRGRSPLDATRVGVIAGSISVTRRGAQPSMPLKREIDAKLRAD
ncbi:MAG: ribokinase [Thermomicrobiales bacterium]|nr:ribokinase [Thermomicrobiales bacterium]